MPEHDIGYDRYVYKHINCVIPFFCKHNIHPNIITIFGIFLNIIIYLILKEDNINIFNLSVILIFRFYIDALDGEVARQCNKKSKLGGLLDVHSDMIEMSILLCYILKVFNIIELNITNTISLYILMIFFFVFLKENCNYSFSEHSHNSDLLRSYESNTIIIIFIYIIFVYITK